MEQVEFSGSIPAVYESCLRPLLFEPCAKWLAGRLEIPAGAQILELAAGTGALTRQLLAVMPATARLTATDLHSGMLDIAQSLLGEDPRLHTQIADAQDLPFESESFQVVVCQFGWMFFPDKDLAARQAFRVLTPGGSLRMLNWHGLAENEATAIAKAVIGRFLPDGPPRGFDIPFGFDDRAQIEATLSGAGFTDVGFEDLHISGTATPDSAAKGLCRGTPMALELAERVPNRHDDIEQALADAYRARYGEGDFSSPLSALSISARRP